MFFFFVVFTHLKMRLVTVRLKFAAEGDQTDTGVQSRDRIEAES